MQCFKSGRSSFTIALVIQATWSHAQAAVAACVERTQPALLTAFQIKSSMDRQGIRSSWMDALQIGCGIDTDKFHTLDECLSGVKQGKQG